MTEKKRLLIFYDWFYPGYKAGGPIQSITNLIIALVPDFQVYVVTGMYDLNSDVPYENVAENEWNAVVLPGSNSEINIYYASKAALDKEIIEKLFLYVSPDALCLNGIFSYRFFLLPLMFLKGTKSSLKIVICPRGMLKRTALEAKRLKKKIYLRYLRFSKLVNNAIWLATNEEEANDIQTHFRLNKGIVITPNIPKVPLAGISFLPKETGELKLVYLSLINPHKNLLLLLQTIKNTDAKITLDIFGPIVDKAYWKQCEALIKQIPKKAQYRGLVQPINVQQVLSQHHVLILFTKGENFGHAIYESLSVGRPVITSHFTPWQNLYENRAGANVDLDRAEDCLDKINGFAKMSHDEYIKFCTAAHILAISYFKKLDAEQKYRDLFF